jgi:RNA polymerase subunit RPABC4/transcription elongation factor Spt4
MIAAAVALLAVACLVAFMVTEPPRCLQCNTTRGVTAWPSYTAYADPEANRSVPLCPPCGEEHREYWAGMWADYYSGCL